MPKGEEQQATIKPGLSIRVCLDCGCAHGTKKLRGRYVKACPDCGCQHRRSQRVQMTEAEWEAQYAR